MRNIALAGLVTLLLSGLASAAEPVTVDIRPSTSNVGVGEKFRVTLEAHGPRGIVFDFPKTISTGSVDLNLVPTATTSSSAVYDAQIFALGKDAAIPSLQLPYRTSDGRDGTLETEALPLNVVSLLDPGDKNPAPADYAPPVPVLVTRVFWVFAGLTVVLAAALLVWLARRLRFPKAVPSAVATPSISPEEAALKQLDALARTLPSPEARAFYIDIVQVLKQYLERRLEAPVLEMTTTETLAFVRAHEWTGEHAPRIRDLVHAADLVKFGGATEAPLAEQHLALVRDVVSWVDRARRAEEDRQAREEALRKTA